MYFHLFNLVSFSHEYELYSYGLEFTGGVAGKLVSSVSRNDFDSENVGIQVNWKTVMHRTKRKM